MKNFHMFVNICFVIIQSYSFKYDSQFKGIGVVQTLTNLRICGS